MVPTNSDSIPVQVAATDLHLPLAVLHRFSSGSKSDQDQAPEVPRSGRDLDLSPTTSASSGEVAYGTRKTSASLCKSTRCDWCW
jgi:hypothetical protein